MPCNMDVVEWAMEDFSMQIDQVPGLEQELILRLRAAGIRNCRQLLRVSRRRARMSLLCQTADLSPEMLHLLVRRIELYQIRGIGPAMLDNLWQLDVRSVEDLAAWEPADLQQAIRTVAERPPNLAVIEDWILQAQRRKGKQPAALSYGLPT